ncbi:amino acid ABC transporter ATP-binding protein [Ruania zhangjianzhongii]|uniref:amino acid ABC transporter ATP-binding protein n=1 Tax=Ruania zhangjianzhongii TaxID=2603206 RepID=UPI0011CB5A4E|nr:amino acid ABC transporter ATP-binding protein [Ruania zhangjianzhongii]
MSTLATPPHTSKPTTEIVARVHKVNKSFGSLHVLKDIDLEIHKGEVVLLLGPSGSGKSTLLRTLNVLETIDSGEITISDELMGQRRTGKGLRPLRESRIAEQRRRTGMVFQQFNLFPNMTALENVASGPIHVAGKSKQKSAAAAKELLAMVGLPDKGANYPSHLSGGQQQRVAIARALAMRPDIMLFDEPTSALDPEMVKEVLETLINLRKDGMTMIVVSHEMAFARAAADRVIFMDDGEIVEQASPAEFFDNPKTERARKFLGQLV